MIAVPDDYVEPLAPSIEEIRAKEALKAIENMKTGERVPVKPYTKLKASEWREIEILWESGEVTLTDLVERFGRNKDTYAGHFRKFGIKKGARAEELKKLAQQQAAEQAKTDAGIISARIKQTKDSHYKMSEAIAKLTFNEVLSIRQKGGKFREIQNDVKTLLLAAETLKKVREERWAILGLDKDAIDEDTLPELIMSTMTPEQAQELRNAQREDEAEMGLDDDKLVAEKVLTDSI